MGGKVFISFGVKELSTTYAFFQIFPEYLILAMAWLKNPKSVITFLFSDWSTPTYWFIMVSKVNPTPTLYGKDAQRFINQLNTLSNEEEIKSLKEADEIFKKTKYIR